MRLVPADVRRLVPAAACATFALAVFAAVNEISVYKRNGGPILLRLRQLGAVHVGDLLVLGTSFAAATLVARRLTDRFWWESD